MIDAHKTGAYIARLRKERDWTQSELADMLHVTHQAVSRWETGDSFPDLGTLAQLAQMFRVRMDSLMEGGMTTSPTDTLRDKVLVELAAGHAEIVAELVKAEPSDLETVIESGPLTRPSLMNKVVKNMSGYQFNLQQVMELAPFVGQELLDSLVAGLGEKLDIQGLVELAPHISRPELDRLVGQFEGALGIGQITSLAPFIDHSRLASLVSRVGAEKIEPGDLIALAPFLDRSTLEKMIRTLRG